MLITALVHLACMFCVKPNFHYNGKVIGCHLIGLNLDEILQGFALAIKIGLQKKILMIWLSSIRPMRKSYILFDIKFR